MTIIFVYDNDMLKPTEPEKIKAFKQTLQRGDIVTGVLTKGDESSRDKQSRLFHALRDAYSRETGYSMPAAKHELKYLYGIWLPVCEETLTNPPTWEGQILEMYERLIFMKSTRNYNASEWSHLIDGTKTACLEVGVDLGTVEGAV